MNFLKFLEIDFKILKDQYFKDHLIYKVDNYKTIQNLSYEQISKKIWVLK